ncbi:FBD domain-containing protein [Heracleum sosnowskyi]|uniref:FBD domain-containing protein n=1 Tax=Heracleum sosnowskyi TaxID=360622 RepID=A0AAD8GW02_9APIA|nr:FBD domain-containing protein [Heracleum sosnowskyi]
MAESSTRKVRRTHSKKDRISVLPRNILETILCFLPIQDAVRTSILSRSWRHCWTTIPNLVFDDDISSISFGTSECECNGLELMVVKYVSVINKILILHDGPLLKFFLRFPSLCKARVIHDYLDQWIPLFSRKGIKQLTILGYDRWHFTAHNFSSLGLTHLRLANFWFPCIPAFGGMTYTYLRIIELIGVATTENSIFDCPVLEKLTLMVSYGLSHTNFRAPNLKCLHQHYREMISEYSSAGLENLREYSFRLSGDPPIMQTETPNVVNVLSSLHKIEKFSIAKYFMRYLAAGGLPKRLSRPLSYLRTLSCFDINFTCLAEVSCLLCLIRSAPNLCKLHISVDPDPEEGNFEESSEEDFQDCSADQFQDCTADHLEIVTFSHFQGLKAELELVKFLLARSPLLKTMFIHRNLNMEKDVAFKSLEEMLEFSRASSRAQIKSLKYPFGAVDYGPWVNDLDICDFV